MYYKRTLETAVHAASRKFPVILVTGPRQAGKTTLLRHLCEAGRRYVTLDDLAVRALAQEGPSLFLERFPSPLLIDEIQYAPHLLPGIKMRVDSRRKGGAFWLTGSQQFQLMKGVSESLAGRVAILNLLGFSMREQMKRDAIALPFLPSHSALAERAQSASPVSVASIFRTIWRGSLPALAVCRGIDRDLFYNSYLQTYLQRDVRDLAQVGDQAAFVRFLRACAARTGQLLNYSDLARDVDVSVKTAQHWLSILVTSFQVALLQPYHTNVTARLVKTPKLYFLDTGLAAYLTEWASPETLAAGAMGGAIFETFVFAEILKGWWNRMRVPPLYYYRDKDGKEIDLLFVHDRTLHPVEVKLGATPRRDWVRHFSVLKTLKLPIGEGGVVCLCKELLPLDEANSAIPAGFL